jgi:DNA-binding MarR family transcriptional regulator
MKLPTYITGNVQSQAYRTLREHVYISLSEFDLTPSYWTMLGIIIEARDGIRQADIARIMRVKAPLITMMARQMKKRNFVQIVPNQFDSRAKLLAITPEGKKYVKTVENNLNKALDMLLIGLTENDLITYHKVLTTIIANDSASDLRS